MKRVILLCGAGFAAAAAPSPAPLELGAASNFSQGWSETTWRAARNLPLRRLRDGMRWADVERTPGRYTFDKPATTWPDRFAKSGVRITLTLNWGNPLYDGGMTPHSPEALSAFGRFASAVVQRFPQIDTLEIGNEVNGGNFVSGPVKQAGLAARGQYHLAMVRAAALEVQKVRPEVQVLGGATHSLPGGFLWPLLKRPGAQAIAGLAVHPYTTPIDQLAAQIGLLRRQPALARVPLHVTEFGSADPARAADDLVRGYAALAVLGVTEMDWYPLNERGDGLLPLVRRDGSLTPAGRAFRLVQSRLAGEPARDASPGPFTFVRRFGPYAAVLWGAPRTVTIDPRTTTALDATGARLDPDGLALREDRPLVLVSTQPLSGAAIRFGCQPLVADSFYQFGYPAPGGGQAPGDTFERAVRIAGRDVPFTVMPGQQRRGVPWTPYLGLEGRPRLRLTADTVLPALSGAGADVVLRYTVQQTARLRIEAEFTVSARSTGGIAVTLLRGGRSLLSRAGRRPVRIDMPLDLRKGEVLTLSIGPNATARGDLTRYRIRIFDENRCRQDSPPQT